MATKQTKDRILDATAELFQRYGYTGAGLKQIVAQASAPFGSIYHHFPGGKEQLAAEVIHREGAMYQELVMSVFSATDDLLANVAGVFEAAGAVLEATDFLDACPIATVALEVASSNETLRMATAEVFERWIAAATDQFVAQGAPEAEARDLGIVLIELLEGAFLLCRAAKDTEAMRAAGRAAVILVSHQVEAPGRT